MIEKKTIMLVCCIFVAATYCFAQADSTWEKRRLIDMYMIKGQKKEHFKVQDSAYTPAQQDSLYKKAVTWKKWAYQYPLIMNYLHQADTSSPIAKKTLADLEANPKKADDLLAKAIKYYQVVGFPGQPKPGSPTGSKKGGVPNNDAAIKDTILKTWKF